MKKIFLFLVAAVLAFASCTARLDEKVVNSYDDGKAKKVQYVDKKGNCVKEVEYYQSGQVRIEGPMKDNKRDGEWKSYFLDGRVQSVGYFENGLRTGAATVWYENGNIRQEGFYREGKHVGLWKFYDEQGNFLKEVNYGE